jgi:molybdate-binding protein
LDIAASVTAALADKICVMVTHNRGAGTRTPIDDQLKRAGPAGYWNQPRSHNAVVAAIAQGRADWGVAIKPVAAAVGLGFIPLTEEHYEFAVRTELRSESAVTMFQEAHYRPAGRPCVLWDLSRVRYSPMCCDQVKSAQLGPNFKFR